MEYCVKEERMKTAAREENNAASEVVCPMPSTVARVMVKKGDRVKKGDVLLVIEAMKMEVGEDGEE